MPKYFNFKVSGYYLYFTSHCVVEAMHAHASDSDLHERGSAKFFIKSNGDSVVARTGSLSRRDIRRIQAYIKENYLEMYDVWSIISTQGFFGE